MLSSVRKNFFTQGNKTLLFCCLFLQLSFAEVISVTVPVGDTGVTQILRDGIVDFDSSGLVAYFDSLGYSMSTYRREHDTLFVMSGTRIELDTLFFVSEKSTDTIVIKRAYRASLIQTIIMDYLQELANDGYPFAKLEPSFKKTDTTMTVVVTVDRGPFVESTELEILSSRPVKPWLVERSLLFNRDRLYHKELIDISEQKLRRQPYVKSATFGAPEIKGVGDTVTAILPLFYEGQRQLFFDGALAYQSEGKYHLTGRAELSLNNLFGIGEQLGFSYSGEGHWQRAKLILSLPYMGGSSLSLGLKGAIEVGDDGGGLGEVAFRLAIDVMQFWQVGFGGDYHEVFDSVSRQKYGGITLDMIRLHNQLQEYTYDWQAILKATSGFTGGSSQALARASADVDFLIHIPFGSFAYLGELRGGVMAFADKDVVLNYEKFRLGGHKSVRGYDEELYPAIGFAYNRSAFRWYISHQGALYLFMDNAVKVQDRYVWADAFWMMGYGLGISLSVRSLRVSLEWARHRMGTSGLGRLHFSISN